ncbi:MAG: ribosome maturation factor RimM [Erysipelotrichaceae bacterium]
MDEIKIGVICGTHGLKGEVSVKSLSDFDEIRFKKGNVVYLKENQCTPLTIKTMRVHKDRVLLSFEGYDDINEVEKWKGLLLVIDKSNLHSLEGDDVYYFQLRNMQVFDENNECLGEVKELIETGANLVLRIDDGTNSFLMPYVSVFVKETNVKENKLVVHLLEGMR